MIAAITGITEVGCGMNLKTENYQVMAEDAMKYIEEKYDKDFTMEGYELSDYLSTTDEVFCYTDEMDRDLKEYAHIFVIKEGGVHFGDDYFGYLIRPQVEAYILELMESEFPDVKVLMGLEHKRIKDSLGKDSTLDDFFSEEDRYRITSHVYIKYDPSLSRNEYEEKLHRIMDRMTEKHQNWFFKFYTVNDEIFDGMERKTQSDFLDYTVKSWDPDGDKYYSDDTVRIDNGEITFKNPRHCM